MSAQVSILPPIFEDEAIGFYVRRVRALSGSRSYRDVTRALFGQPLDHVDWALPCNLDQFAQSTAALTQGANADYWIHKHTLLPYYAATATPHLVETLRSRMLSRQIGPMRQWHALTVSEVAHRHARYCHMCAQEDVAKLGVRYVRTFHLLPNVSYCPVHGTPLVTLDAAALLTHSVTCPLSAPGCIPSQSLAELRFAKESFRLLRTGIGGREAYFSTLQESGWWNGGKLIHRARLRAWIREFWCDDYLDFSLQELTQTDAGLARTFGCFGTKRRLVHPVAAVLVLSACEAQPMMVPHSHTRARNAREDYRRRLELAMTAFDAGASLTESAREAEISVTALATATEASGRTVKRRPKHVTPALAERIKKRVVRGELLSTIAHEERVSLSTVYRIRKACIANLADALQSKRAAAVLQHRQFWLTNLFAHPNMTIRQMRTLMPATYAWLYRHDRTWLIAQNAVPRPLGSSRHAVRRTQRHDLTAILTSTANRLLRSHGQPVRLTAAYLFRSAGLTFVRRRQLANVLVDTPESFLERRIGWAKKILSEEGTERIAWRVFRKTGLRRKTWESTGL